MYVRRASKVRKDVRNSVGSRCIEIGTSMINSNVQVFVFTRRRPETTDSMLAIRSFKELDGGFPRSERARNERSRQ